MKLVVMIPAYNEEKTIDKVIEEIPREIEGFDRVEVLVIDDGSTDNTAGIARKAGADHIVTHKENLGLSGAFKTGLETALKLGADIIVNIDADGQYNAGEIPKIVKPILDGEADIVIGDRQIEKLDHMPFPKRIGNKIATWVTRQLSGLPIKDAQSGFRGFSKEAAMRINLLGEYTYVQEMIIQAAYKKLKIAWVPIEFREREGESRLIPNIWSYAKKAGSTMIRTYRDFQPLRVFFSIGLVFLFAGFVFGLRVLLHYFKAGMVTPYLPSAVLSVVSIVIGTLSIILGLIADKLKMQRLLIDEILYKLKQMEIERGK